MGLESVLGQLGFDTTLMCSMYSYYVENWEEIRKSRFADFYSGCSDPNYCSGIDFVGLYERFLEETGDSSTSYKKSDWYCTNRPTIETDFDLPSTIKPENVKKDPLW